MEEWNDDRIMRKEKEFIGRGFGSKVYSLSSIVHCN
jgi:hypothetical protein